MDAFTIGHCLRWVLPVIGVPKDRKNPVMPVERFAFAGRSYIETFWWGITRRSHRVRFHHAFFSPTSTDNFGFFSSFLNTRNQIFFIYIFINFDLKKNNIFFQNGYTFVKLL